MFATYFTVTMMGSNMLLLFFESVKRLRAKGTMDSVLGLLSWFSGAGLVEAKGAFAQAIPRRRKYIVRKLTSNAIVLLTEVHMPIVHKERFS